MKLITIKDWEIRTYDNKNLNTVKVTGRHIDCTARGDDISWFANEPPVCWDCKAKVPDEIQCLIYLHEGMDNY